jgi:hypothetical protein
VPLFFFAHIHSHIHQLQYSLSIRPRVKSRSNIQALKQKITSSESGRYFQQFRKAVTSRKKPRCIDFVNFISNRAKTDYRTRCPETLENSIYNNPYSHWRHFYDMLQSNKSNAIRLRFCNLKTAVSWLL